MCVCVGFDGSDIYFVFFFQFKIITAANTNMLQTRSSAIVIHSFTASFMFHLL